MFEKLSVIDPWTAVFFSGLGAALTPLLCSFLVPLARRLGLLPSRIPSGKANAPGQPRDQLKGIEGIGPKIAALLYPTIHSFAELAKRTPDELKELVNLGGEDFDLARAYTWPTQARLLSLGRIEEFLLLVGQLRAGVPTLESIHGIGPETGRALRRGGIPSLHALASQDEAGVAAILDKADIPASGRDVGNWLMQARRIISGDTGEILALAGLTAGNLEPLSPLDSTEDNGDNQNSWVRKSFLPRFRDGQESCLICSIILGGITTTSLLILCWLGGRCPGPCTVVRPPIECKAPKQCIVPPPPPPVVEKENIPADGLFDFAKPSLKEESESKIRDFVSAIQARAEKPVSIAIVGHADCFGPARYNLQLSRDRADEVESRLRAATNFPPEIFISYGRGSTQPVTKEGDCKGFSPEVPKHPTQEAKDLLQPDRRVVISALFETISPSSSE
jgi:outer membrane protein OmpA-like peptidoglycan-associated protein/predicted flap endonuclease-1-like 5' DNA nuclease